MKPTYSMNKNNLTLFYHFLISIEITYVSLYISTYHVKLFVQTGPVMTLYDSCSQPQLRKISVCVCSSYNFRLCIFINSRVVAVDKKKKKEL
jgi:hypothetical protein